MFGFQKRNQRQSDFEAIALPHIDALFGVALRYTRRPRDAEDLVQDTYLKAFRSFDSFERGTNIRAWLFKILTNTFINDYRRSVKEREALGGLARDEDVLADNYLSRDQLRALRDPEATFFDGLLSDEVQHALEQVPVDFRIAVILSDIQDFSYREISEIMGCPVGTVMSRLFRGRRILQSKLYDYAVARGVLKTPPPDESNPSDLDEFRRKKLAR